MSEYPDTSMEKRIINSTLLQIFIAFHRRHVFIDYLLEAPSMISS